MAVERKAMPEQGKVLGLTTGGRTEIQYKHGSHIAASFYPVSTVIAEQLEND